MVLQVRRVVTGHDAEGKAKVLFDGVGDNLTSGDKRERVLLWTTDTLPANNDGQVDDGARQGVGPGLPEGSVFAILRAESGAKSRMHRTSTIDYGYIISGRITLKLDVGEVTLNAGDTFIQRGTVHAWDVPGPEPCTYLVAMVGANPATAGGKPLPPHF